MTQNIKSSPEITRVEIQSVWWLCEKDLTWSSHILIVTYVTGQQVAHIIDAGAFQKKSEQDRNIIFEEIYKKYKVWGITLTHGHFDHAGRLVATHKAIRNHHMIPDLPIYTSPSTRSLLPHILQSYHGLAKNDTHSFDKSCGDFWQAFNAFEHSYSAKPKEERPSRKDHRARWDRLRDARAEKERKISDLENEFIENGGTIKGRHWLTIPKDLPNKKHLKNILKAIRELQSNESDKYSREELFKINRTRQYLDCLGLWRDISDYFEDKFAVEIPRTDRKWRLKRIQEFRKYIEERINLHRETLLPEITPQDIDSVIQNIHWLDENISYNLPWLPSVQMSLYPNGHILWSVGVKFIFTMVGDRVKSLLCSGDIGRFEENGLHGDPVTQEADAGIVETTYANKQHPEKWPEIDMLVDFVKKGSWPILMPVFSLDRMYVVLHELREKIVSWEIDCPIYCRNILGESTLRSYVEKYPDLKPVIDRVQFVGGEDAHKIMRKNNKCIMIASWGTFQDTSSANNLLNTSLDSGQESTIILTWYQPAGIGRILMEFCRWTEDPESTITVYLTSWDPCEIKRKNILLTGIFSGHGDHEDLRKYASAIKGNIYWIHGDPKWANVIKDEFPGSEIIERDQRIVLF